MSRTTPRALGVLLLLALAAGCGSAPERYEPTGVDELVIPTPSPDPDDFVDEIDNELLPLVPGTAWEYAAEDGRRITVTVTDETREVAGVSVTVVQDSGVEEWYAQDDDGNVWFFGREGVWEAGVDGAEAGLAMPAEPRLGDGYVRAHVSEDFEELVEVVDVDAAITVGNDDFEGALETRDTVTSAPEVTHRFYAPGFGLIYEEPEGAGTALELVSFRAG